MNEWKNLWNSKKADYTVLASLDERELFTELKRLNGFDVIEDSLSYESFIEQYQKIKRELAFDSSSDELSLSSVFEVGCGSGANLYLFEKDHIKVGGIDYSETLIECAKAVLPSEYHSDILVGGGIEMPTDKSYTAAFANSVFSYFESHEYALEVLDKMSTVAEKKIGLIDIHDIEKKDEFISFRKQSVENYEEKYKNFPKLFYSKEFFIEYAQRKNMDVKFCVSDMKGYWNNPYVFHCYLTKK